MRDASELLAEINSDLPQLDWKQGARDYVAAFCARYTKQQIEEFIHTKPLAAVTPEDPAGSLEEISGYLLNFANSIRLLNLKRGSRILDVACGGGWYSHWLRRLGYEAIGLDISEDFVRLAKQRLLDDPYLHCSPEAAEGAYRVHDLETAALPDQLIGSFDAIVLESCLHHFFNPISAMKHIVQGLRPDGVILVLEGENRMGPLKEDYLAVMRDTSTLERPYSRTQFLEILKHAGLDHVEFVGVAHGFLAESADHFRNVKELLSNNTNGMNNCVCATNEEALKRVIPTYRLAPLAAAGFEEPEPPAREIVTEEAPAPTEAQNSEPPRARQRLPERLVALLSRRR